VPKAGETHESRIKRLEEKLDKLQQASEVDVSAIIDEVATLNKAVRLLVDDIPLIKHDIEEHLNKPDAHHVALMPRHGKKTVGAGS